MNSCKQPQKQKSKKKKSFFLRNSFELQDFKSNPQNLAISCTDPTKINKKVK
jgi:hypothetical protein